MKNLLFVLGLSVFSFAAHSGVIKADIKENFVQGDFMDVPGQHKGHYKVRNTNGGILHLGTESWTYISIDNLFGLNSLNLDAAAQYTLNFDMRVKQGNNKPAIPSEIGGVLLANENVANLGADDGVFAFNLSGSQDFGSKKYKYDFERLNDGKPTWQSFNVDLSSVLSGNYEYLVFINDCDETSCANSTQFRNISVQVPEPYTFAVFALSAVGLVSLRRKNKR